MAKNDLGSTLKQLWKDFKKIGSAFGKLISNLIDSILINSGLKEESFFEKSKRDLKSMGEGIGIIDKKSSISEQLKQGLEEAKGTANEVVTQVSKGVSTAYKNLNKVTSDSEIPKNSASAHRSITSSKKESAKY